MKKQFSLVKFSLKLLIFLNQYCFFKKHTDELCVCKLKIPSTQIDHGMVMII